MHLSYTEWALTFKFDIQNIAGKGCILYELVYDISKRENYWTIVIFSIIVNDLSSKLQGLVGEYNSPVK